MLFDSDKKHQMVSLIKGDSVWLLFGLFKYVSTLLTWSSLSTSERLFQLTTSRLEHSTRQKLCCTFTFVRLQSVIDFPFRYIAFIIKCIIQYHVMLLWYSFSNNRSYATKIGNKTTCHILRFISWQVFHSLTSSLWLISKILLSY